MKRLVMFFTLMAFTVAMMAQGRCLMPVTDKDGYANVRKGMTTKSSVVRKVKKGADVYVTPTGTDWYRVSLSETGAYIGYIHYSCVKPVSDFASLYKVTDKDGYTNVRQLATTSSPIVDRMKTGQEFEGLSAFVNGDYSKWIGVLDNKGRLKGFVYYSNVVCIAQ